MGSSSRPLAMARSVPLAVLAVLMSVCGCAGSSAPETDAGDIPARVRGEPVEVAVCELVPAASASALVQQKLELVSVEYTAARVPTLRCGLGKDFGVPLLTVELATGPISPNVFEGSYGGAAGGDPVFIRKLGDGAFLRQEKEQQNLHVFVNGSILSVQLQVDPTDPVSRASVLELARQAIEHLPANPRLARTEIGAECSSVTIASTTAAIGAIPDVASQLRGPDGSIMCSWASNPGAVVITTIVAPAQVRAYRRSLDDVHYVEVDDIFIDADVTVLSNTDRAGDLLIIDGDQAMATITVIPTAGFSDGSVGTTPGQRALAKNVIAQLP